MKLSGKIIVVTGGAHGIGKGLCRRFAAEKAAHIVIVDVDTAAAQKLAAEIGGTAYTVDVGDGDAVKVMLDDVHEKVGPVDLFCSNAGVGFADGAHVAAASAEVWENSWRVNVLAHVHAARVLLPRMLARGSGYFLITASAAGLLSQIGSASYSTTKHAAVGFAEALAIAHGDMGIGVSVLCPQGVDTRMMAAVAGGGPQGADGVISTAQVADDVITALDKESFLVLPHPKVSDYMQMKIGDYDRWITGMQRLRDKFST